MCTNWKTKNIRFEKSTIENKFIYNVTEILEWETLGLKLYTESKEFKDILELVK